MAENDVKNSEMESIEKLRAFEEHIGVHHLSAKTAYSNKTHDCIYFDDIEVESCTIPYDKTFLILKIYARIKFPSSLIIKIYIILPQ